MLNKRSLTELTTVNARLALIVLNVARLSKAEVQVTDGKRSTDEQQMLVMRGKSRTLDSRHLTGDAVDLVVIQKGQARWDAQHYADLNELMQQEAAKLDVELTWGGTWPHLRDYCHWEITRPDGHERDDTRVGGINP